MNHKQCEDCKTEYDDQVGREFGLASLMDSLARYVLPLFPCTLTGHNHKTS